VKVSIHLNGESPVYPMAIPFEVFGDSDDHTLTLTEVVIESGTDVDIAFSIVEDGVVEDDEQLEITLSDSLNLGAKHSHSLLITEGNIAPEITLSVMQAQEQRLTVSQAGGEVTIISSVYDANQSDSFSYQWQTADASVVNLSVDETQFSFDPQTLTTGVYQVWLTVMDDGSPQASDVASVHIEVVAALMALTDADSDGDLIPDNIEGYQDGDGDGIPDYLDRISECNVLQEEASIDDGYLIEGQSGVCLRRGDLTFGGQTGGAQITDEDIDASAEDNLIEDVEAINVGGIFDYIAYGLPDTGSSFAIVMPQRKPIPGNAVYRKYRATSGWGFFIEDVSNSLWSTQGEPGYCPPPNSSDQNNIWTLGLTEGHWCVQQIIEDGGVNDDDQEVNGTIVDPGGVGVMQSNNNLPVAVDDHLEMMVNETITIDVLFNDTDEDGDNLTISSASSNIGNVTIVNGALMYTPQTNYGGDITIDYGINDNNGGTDHARVYIVILANDDESIEVEAKTSGGGAFYWTLALLMLSLFSRRFTRAYSDIKGQQ